MSTKTVLRVEVGFSTQTGVKWVEVRTAADYRHLVRISGNPVGLRYWDDTVSIMQERPKRDELPLSGAIPSPQTSGLLSFKSGAGEPTGTDAAPMTFVITSRHDGTNAVVEDNPAEDPRLWGKMVAADDLPTYRAGGEQQGMMETIRQIIREATFALDVQENVKVGYNGPNGTRWFICDTPRKYYRIVRFLGMPAYVGTIEPEPGKDYIPVTIPDIGAQLIADTTKRARKRGTYLKGERSTLIPRTVGITYKGTETGHFVTTKTNVFVTGPSEQLLDIGEILTLRVTCGKCGYSIRKCSCADKPSEISLQPGTTVYTTHGRGIRYAPPEKWRDGTIQPEPGTYLINSEPGHKGINGRIVKKGHKLTQEDMNRMSEEEMVEVRLMTRRLGRSRDQQRDRTRSDIGRVNDDSGRKPDGADMYDAMQDSVLYLAEQLRWAHTLTEAASCINGVGTDKVRSWCNCGKPDGCRRTVAWSYIPARFRKEAEEADIAGIEYDLGVKTRIVTRTGLKWTAARNALKEHFSVQDAAIRVFLGKMLIRDTMGEVILSRLREVEYEQTVDEGQPGTSWGMSLRTKSKGYKSGGTVAKPQYVGIAALRTSQDNPYSAETFQAAVDMSGGWDNLPMLREALTIGMNDARVGKKGRSGVITQMAASRNDGIIPSGRQITGVSERMRTEWEIVRDNLDLVRDLTDRHNQYEQGIAEGKDSK